MTQDSRAMALLVGGEHDKELHLLPVGGAGSPPAWIEVGGRPYVMRDQRPLIYRAAAHA